MTIPTVRQVIKRYNTNAANAHHDENKKQIQNLKELRATSPTTELIEITSSKDLIRTIEKQTLFNGPWLQEDVPENQTPATITVWKITNGTPRIYGPARADQTGMLDTARHTYCAESHSTAQPPEKVQETELFRKANVWHTHTNLRSIDRETIRMTTPQLPYSPPNAREQLPKRSQYHQPNPDPTNKNRPPTEPYPGIQGRPTHTRNPKQHNRYTRSNTLLAEFRLAPLPSTVFNHLYTSNDPAELVHSNEELSRYQTKNKAYQRLLIHRNHLIKVADANTTLTAKA
jgi:hypothetical protein